MSAINGTQLSSPRLSPLERDGQIMASTPPPALDAPLAEWADWHHIRGELEGSTWITPLRPGTRKAYQDDWTKCPLKTREAVRAHWKANPNDNIGLVPRPGHFWLDADDLDVLETAEGIHGALPPTYTQRSLNGRLQFLFSGDVTSSGAVHVGDRQLGEYRGAGTGQCVGAGSRGTTEPEKTGKPAAPGHWEVEDNSPVADAPDWVLKLGKTSSKPTSGNGRKDFGEVIQWDHEQARRLVAIVDAGRLIKDYEGAFMEGERDDLTFQLFAEARNRMIHPHAMLEAVQESGIDCDLGGEVVEAKMRSAYTNGNAQGEYGDKVPWFQGALMFRPVLYADGVQVERKDIPPPDPVEWKAKNHDLLPSTFRNDPKLESLVSRDTDVYTEVEPYPVLSGAALFDRTPIPYMIKRTIPAASLILLMGAWGTMKSFLALHIVGRWAAGLDVFGQPSRNSRRVLYVAAEGGGGMRRRAEGLRQQLGLSEDEFPVGLLTMVPHLTDEAQMRRLRATMSHGNYGAVVYDTASRGISGEDENANATMSAVIEAMEKLKQTTGAAVFIVHHTNDSGSSRGGKALPAGVDVVLKVERDKAANVLTVSNEKMKDDEEWRKAHQLQARQVTLEGWYDEDGGPVTTVVLDHVGEVMHQAKTTKLKDDAKLLELVREAGRERGGLIARFSEIATAAKKKKWEGFSESTLKRNHKLGRPPMRVSDGASEWMLMVKDISPDGGSTPTRCIVAQCKSEWDRAQWPVDGDASIIH